MTPYPRVRHIRPPSVHRWPRVGSHVGYPDSYPTHCEFYACGASPEGAETPRRLSPSPEVVYTASEMPRVGIELSGRLPRLEGVRVLWGRIRDSRVRPRGLWRLISRARSQPRDLSGVQT